MSDISTKLTYLNTTKTKIKDSINLTGAGITNNDTFRSYSPKLRDSLVDIINNGTATLYDNFPKETGSGSNITLNNTYQAPMKIDLKGDTYQETYTGKNLFNKFKSASSTNGASLTQINNGIKVTVTVAGANKFIVLKLDNPANLLGKTLTISGNIEKSDSNDPLIRFYFTNGDTLVSKIADTIYKTGKSTFTVPASYPTNCNGISIVFNATAGYSGSVGNYVNYTNIQLEVGSTQTSYEPYVGGTASPSPNYPQNIETVTGLQTIDITGKNLFDKDSNKLVNMNINTSTLKIYSDNTCTLSYIKCQPNTTYTISRRAPMTNRFVVATSENTPALNTDLLSATAITNNTTTSITITTPATANYIIVRFVYNNSDNYNTYASTIQIEKSSTATEYEQYKNQSYPIDLRSKNLFNPSNVLAGYNINYVTGVADIATNRSILNYTVIKPNTDYIVSGLIIKNTAFYDKNKTFISSVQNSYTFTTPSNAYYLRFGFDNTQSYSQAQLEEGTTATTYEAFNQIELCEIDDYQDSIKKSTGKNLFDNDSVKNNVYLDANGNETSSNYWDVSDYIKVNENTKYTYQGLTAVGSDAVKSVYYDINKNIISVFKQAIGTNTITTPNNCCYIRFPINKNNVDDINTFMIEQGETATEYEPYGEVWYIHKEIGKIVLDGSEDYILNTEGFTIDYVNWRTLVNNNCINKTPFLTNYYKNYTTYSDLLAQNYGIGMIYSSNQNVYIRNTSITSVADFKTWLSTHNTIVYYVLATPTNTEITNTELINQLDLIEQAYSYLLQTNIIVNYTNGNKPFIINASALLKEE